VDDGTGTPTLDATIGDINVAYELNNEDIHLDNCTVGDIEDVLNWFGLSLYDLILGQLDSYLQSAVADIGPTLESTIEDAFSSATISQEIDLNGVAAQVDLYPSDVVIVPAGVRVQMSGSMSAPAAACVEAYDPGGSLKTPSEAPEIGDIPAAVDADYHVGVTLSDDFTNEALYALWRGGLLCYSLAPGGAFPLDTSILNALSGDAFLELYPESQPMTLQTSPKAAPTASYDGSHDIDMNLTDLGLDFYTDLDGREAKMLTIDLDGTVGADLNFDGTTGNLAIAVDLDPAALTPTVAYNEFYPAANDAILAGFSGTFSSLLDTVVGGLLDNLSFAMPAFSGIGLQELVTAPNGSNEDWLGNYAWVGATTYVAADGCSGDGCGSGCSGGCDTAPGVSAFWPALGLLIFLRRRE
jgi:hypothetical protein